MGEGFLGKLFKVVVGWPGICGPSWLWFLPPPLLDPIFELLACQVLSTSASRGLWIDFHPPVPSTAWWVTGGTLHPCAPVRLPRPALQDARPVPPPVLREAAPPSGTSESWCPGLTSKVPSMKKHTFFTMLSLFREGFSAGPVCRRMPSVLSALLHPINRFYFLNSIYQVPTSETLFTSSLATFLPNNASFMRVWTTF